MDNRHPNFSLCRIYYSASLIGRITWVVWLYWTMGGCDDRENYTSGLIVLDDGRLWRPWELQEWSDCMGRWEAVTTVRITGVICLHWTMGGCDDRENYRSDLFALDDGRLWRPWDWCVTISKTKQLTLFQKYIWMRRYMQNLKHYFKN